jgi:hypothetical protein
MGDPVGIKQYSRISGEPLEKWKRVLGNPLRKAWCRRYLRWIGSERLGIMGYSLDDLLRQLELVPNGVESVGSDLFYLSYGVARNAMGQLQKAMPVFS